ncbi:hypothetical protein DFH27DRAFT_64897 [Peziza echinospora]|nr:hypothetical protein DFH27DRAFT_64897 [Peziza echinospora]
MVWGWFSGSSAPATLSPPTSTQTNPISPPPPPPPPPTQPTTTTPSPISTTSDSSLPAQPAPSPPLPESVRLRRQLTLLLAGPLFLSCSLLVTRRSLARKYLSTIPPRFHSNQHPPLLPPNGAMDAFEALNLATLNVAGFAVTLVGGAMFALDVCNVEELRTRLKGDDGLGGDMMPEAYKELKRKEREAEEEMEEWMVQILARKEVKERAKVEAGRILKEMEGLDKGKAV